MRNILGRHRLRAVVAAAAVLTLLATPSAGTTQNAETTHSHGAHAKELLDCQPEEGVPVVTVEGLTTTLPQPVYSGAEERTRFVLDLGEVPAGTTARVTATMSWTIETNNWELNMEDAAGTVLGRSWALQPEKPPVEQVFGHERPHCEVFTLVSINSVAAPRPDDSLDTVISVTSVKPPLGISLADCHMTLHLFKDSAERLQAWIPDRSRFTTTGTVFGRPDQALLTFWFYSCRDVAIDGRASGATNLSLVGVVTKHLNPSSFDEYLVWAHTDNDKLTKHLERVGMPVETVQSIEFQRPNEFDAFTSVVSSAGSYHSSMSGYIDDFRHFHDNSFWHDDARLGESQLRIQIGSQEDPIADDWFCKHPYTPEAPLPCSRVSAEPGSALEGLLGGSTRDDSAAFNHLEFDASASLVSYG